MGPERIHGSGWGVSVRRGPFMRVAAPKLKNPPVGLSPVPPMRRSPSTLAMEVPKRSPSAAAGLRSEEHTSELQSPGNHVCRLLLEKNNGIEARQNDHN